MIRIIANVGFRDHTKTLFFKLKLLTVYDINKYRTGSFIFRCINYPYTLPPILFIMRKFTTTVLELPANGMLTK